MKKYSFILAGMIIIICSAAFIAQHKPALHTIGDSTVRNLNKETWGWGTPIASLFDTTKIHVENNAMAGRSTRTFYRKAGGIRFWKH